MQKYNKLIMALFSAAGAACSTGYLSGDMQKWFTFGILVAGAFFVYWVPNLPKQPAPPAVGNVFDVTSLPPVPDAHQPLADPPRPSLADDQPGPPEDDDGSSGAVK